MLLFGLPWDISVLLNHVTVSSSGILEGHSAPIAANVWGRTRVAMHMGIQRRLLWETLLAYFTDEGLVPQVRRLDVTFDKLLFRGVFACGLLAVFRGWPCTLPFSGRPIGRQRRFRISLPRIRVVAWRLTSDDRSGCHLYFASLANLNAPFTRSPELVIFGGRKRMVDGRPARRGACERPTGLEGGTFVLLPGALRMLWVMIPV